MTATRRTLSGRCVAITGAARGIGRETAAALAAAGARVAIGDIDGELAEQTAAAIGAGVVALPLDVTDRGSFAGFLDSAEAHHGPLDVLVNNAGIMPIGPYVEQREEILRRVLDINTWGVMVGCRLALERMLPRDSGHIVNVASQAGKVGFAGGAAYCASKFAVVGLTSSLADELADTGIHVSCVLPAVVQTELSAGLPQTRFVKPVHPRAVAQALLATLERPRRNVHVPRYAAATSLVGLLPPRAKRQVERLLGAEHALLNADRGARDAYEARARGTAPGRRLG